MKLYEMSKEQYEKWCTSSQGVAFNEELVNHITNVSTPKDMYDVLLYAKAMFEREVMLDEI